MFLDFLLAFLETKISDAGTRTRVARVKAEYPNQLDYIGLHAVDSAHFTVSTQLLLQ